MELVKVSSKLDCHFLLANAQKWLMALQAQEDGWMNLDLLRGANKHSTVEIEVAPIEVDNMQEKVSS